jgi:hypothetical protein
MNIILSEFEQGGDARTENGPNGRTIHIRWLRATLPAFQEAINQTYHTVSLGIQNFICRTTY